jgi:CPA1 family monovalent cation:H+ antiporter
VREFVVVGGLGLVIGAVLGYFVSNIVLRNVDDHLIETATTLALAFGSYVVAEELGGSGLLAVVIAGLFVGNLGFQNTSPTTKLTIDNFWEFMAFVANSLVFLLIGLRIEIVKFQSYLVPVVVAVVAILVSRAIVVYGLTWLHGALRSKRPVPTSYRHVMYWAGLRGAISLALALALPDDAVGGAGVAEELRFMAFGVVLFSLLVQGTTIGRVIEFLGLSEHSPPLQEQQRRQALVYAAREGRRELDRLSADGIISHDVWRAMSEVYDLEIADRRSALRDHLDDYQELEQAMVLQAREDVLRAERTAVADAARRGLISDEVQEDLAGEIDSHMAALALMRSTRAHAASRDRASPEASRKERD